MKKRVAGIILCVVLAVTALCGCGKTTEKMEEKEGGSLDTTDMESDDEQMGKTKSSQEEGSNSIVLAYYGGTCEAPIFIGKEKGFFEDEGLDVEITLVTQDTATLVATNKVDAVMVTPALFPGISEGLQISIIDGVHTGCIQGATTKESGITSAADLKGKTIGIATEGDVPQLQLSEEMRVAGLDPKKDVTWVTYPDAQLELALTNGEIDAFASWDPFTEMAIDNGCVRFFSTTSGEMFKDDICCFLAMNPNTLEKNPELGKKLDAAFAKANEFIMANPEEAASVIIDNEYTSGDVDLTARLLGQYEWISNDKEGCERSMRNIVEWCKNGGAISESTDTDQLIEATLDYKGE